MKPQSKLVMVQSKINGDRQSQNRPKTKKKARMRLIANRRERERRTWWRRAQLELAKNLTSCGSVRREAKTSASDVDPGTFAVATAKPHGALR